LFLWRKRRSLQQLNYISIFVLFSFSISHFLSPFSLAPVAAPAAGFFVSANVCLLGRRFDFREPPSLLPPNPDPISRTAIELWTDGLSMIPLQERMIENPFSSIPTL
jgi:hypothetical protein